MVVAFGGAESPEGDSLYGSPPGSSFSVKKMSKSVFKPNW